MWLDEIKARLNARQYWSAVFPIDHAGHMVFAETLLLYSSPFGSRSFYNCPLLVWCKTMFVHKLASFLSLSPCVFLLLWLEGQTTANFVF